MHLQHSLHKPFFYYSKTGKNKNSQLDSWHKWDHGLHSCSKWWSWMEMSEGKKLRCVYLRWYGDELSEVDWWDLPELANLQRSRKSQIQKLDVQHLTAMKGNDLHTDETHIHITNWTNLNFHMGCTILEKNVQCGISFFWNILRYKNTGMMTRWLE